MIQKKLYDTFNEIQKDAFNNCFTIYGDFNGHNNQYESIYLSDWNYIFGLVYCNYGIESQILLLDNVMIVLIGFGKRIMAIDFNTKKEIFQKESIAPFYEFVKTDYCIIAICELDIYAFNSECQLIWFSNLRDIIEDYHILDGKRISIRCSNGDTSVLMLKDGNILT